MATYELRGIYMANQHYYIELSEEHFHYLRTVRKNLLEVLSIEDKFNILIENYAEFEQELAKRSINAMLYQNKDWSSAIDEIHLMNRRVVNLLTTCRLYIDQTSHNICSIYGKDSTQKEEIERQRRLEYDSTTKSGYRVMEAIRNYVQHRELPISSIQHPQQFQGDSHVKHGIRINISVKALSEDKNFKPRIKNELKEFGNFVNLTPLVREYVEAIGRIHLKIRELIKPNLPEWDEAIYEIINQYYNFTGFYEGLALLEIDDLNTTVESFEIFKDFIERRQFLVNKSQYIVYYSSHFISGEASI
jgi:hypothetical protein